MVLTVDAIDQQNESLLFRQYFNHRPEFHCFSRHVLTVLNCLGAGVKCNVTNCLYFSFKLMFDGTAKINLAKPEFPYDMTTLGPPFHISPEMYRYHGTGHLSYPSYDIYAFGMLLWVLCEGSGTARPQVYADLGTNEAMRKAVEKGILPQKLPMMLDACWELMSGCWNQRETMKMDDVVSRMKMIKDMWDEFV